MVVRYSSRKNVRILLVGDRGVGKTSLILSLVSEEFPEDVPSRSEEITIPADVTPEMVPTNIVDYSAAEQTNIQLVEEIQKANVICVVYSIEDDDTMDRVTSYWIPFIRDTLSQSSRCPIVLVGNKTDLVDYSTVDVAMDIMNDYKEVESFVECSAKSLNNVSEIFYYAQKAVLHPTGPLYVSERQDLTAPCKKALTRIFKICDTDNDGLLNDVELMNFQKRCFDTPLRIESVDDIKALLRKNISGGVSPNNWITLTGFLYLHCLFLQRGRSHTTWTVLRHFGYNDNLRMDKNYLHPKVNVPAGCSTELSFKGQQFFTSLFYRFDVDKDGALSPAEEQNLFSICPSPAWGREISHVVPTNSQGWITIHGFLSFWTLKTLHDPKSTLEYLAYLGYLITETENQTSAILVTRDKSLDLLKKQSTRSVYECHVFGAKGVGKTTICRAFIGHSVESASQEPAQPLPVVPCTVNVVQIYGQETYLVLKDMNIDDINHSIVDSDINCDVACLIYDCTNANSFRYIVNLYKRCFSDNKIPVLIVGNKVERCINGEVQQNYKLQPIEYCDKKCLPPPHLFLVNPSRQTELFIKLGTMSAFPFHVFTCSRFHAAWMLFYRHTSGLKVMNLISADSFMWKAGLGLTLVAALGFIVVKIIRCGKRNVK